MTACVLAYSGGLDTSVLIHWLIEKGYEVHAVYVDLGQPCEDRKAIMEKATKLGAKTAELVDAREEMVRDFAFPALKWQAKYEGIYLLGTSLARPLISKICLAVAKKVGASVYVHGATGKGNDQCRFELAAQALDPSVEVFAPWRDAEFRKAFPGRTEMIAYCVANDIPVKATSEKPYSSDENVLHISYESGVLEDLEVCGVEKIDFGMTVSPEEAPDKSEEVTVEFKAGVPVKVNGKSGSPLEVVSQLNEIAGRNAIGRIDIVENRFVGMKSRGVYEAPGMTVLYFAALQIEQLTLDRDLIHFRDQLSPQVAEMIYYGHWYCAKMDALLAFVKESHTKMSGAITLRLYKGNMTVVSRQSDESLYSEAIATMEGGGDYDQTDAQGFLRIQSLPVRVQARSRPRL